MKHHPIYLKAASGALIDTKDFANIIRAKLKRTFPLRFSVITDFNTITISWTDGPTVSELKAITDPYETKGFDSMIDLEYSKQLWLLPNGDARLAKQHGTLSAHGSIPTLTNEKPSPDAILLTNYRRFNIHTSRRHSAQAYRAALQTLQATPFPNNPPIPWEEIQIQEIASSIQLRQIPYITVSTDEGPKLIEDLIYKTVRQTSLC